MSTYYFIDRTKYLVNDGYLLLVRGKDGSIELGHLLLVKLLEYEHIVCCRVDEGSKI